MFPSFHQTHGFVSGHATVVIHPWPLQRMLSTEEPLLLFPPFLSTRPHNQNKSTTRAFPAAMTSRKPSPSPQVNRKHWGKRPCQSPFLCLIRWMCREEWKWTSVRCFSCVFRKLGRFGVQRTRAGAMKGEAEVKSLDRPSMLLLLFW